MKLVVPGVTRFARHTSVVVALVTCNATPRVVRACSCVIDEPEVRLEQSDLVFLGIPREREVVDHQEVFTFDVQRIWKGTDADRVRVSTGFGSSCAAGFPLNRTVLVFASNGSERWPSSSSCSGNVALAHLSWDPAVRLGPSIAPSQHIEILPALQSPKPIASPSRVPDPEEEPWPFDPIPLLAFAGGLGLAAFYFAATRRPAAPR